LFQIKGFGEVRYKQRAANEWGGGGGVPGCLDVKMFGMDKNAWKISKKGYIFKRWVDCIEATVNKSKGEGVKLRGVYF
jgi:hypothetical protein